MEAKLAESRNLGSRNTAFYEMSCGDGSRIQCPNLHKITGMFGVRTECIILQPLCYLLQALRLLPTNINFPLSEITLTPYVPVPETNGEEWDRLELASALDALVELAIHGEYNGLDASKRTKESLELRTAAATVFEVCR